MDNLLELAMQWGYVGLFVAAFVAGTVFPLSSEVAMVALAAAGLVGAVLVIKEIVLALARYFTKLNEQRKMKKLEKMTRGGETA
jgi:membrane protein YqaA with SNARE-associated domain